MFLFRLDEVMQLKTKRMFIHLNCLSLVSDGFRNYLNGAKSNVSAEREQLIDKSQLMGLTAPEMTVLIGGMRVLDTNYDHSKNSIY